MLYAAARNKAVIPTVHARTRAWIGGSLRYLLRPTHLAFNANQIHFIDLVIDCLTQTGWIEAGRLYDSPFNDFSSRGVDGVFNPEEVKQIIAILDNVRAMAAAAAA